MTATAVRTAVDTAVTTKAVRVQHYWLTLLFYVHVFAVEGTDDGEANRVTRASRLQQLIVAV